MEFYTVAQLRTLARQGVIRGVSVVPVPMSDRWYLELDLSASRASVVDSQRHELREFATVEAALSTLRSVGLQPLSLRVAL